MESTGTSPKARYAFLVHSQDTLAQRRSAFDEEPQRARQRRRRTSPEDHAILEAAFATNPKPDKLTRQRVVERVSLGEKEVQNRRQMCRRKSKPSALTGVESDDDIDTSFEQSRSNQTSLSQPSSQSSEGNPVEATCQTFRVDETGVMRPRHPADSFGSERRLPSYVADRRRLSVGLPLQMMPLAFQCPLRRTTSLVKLCMDADGKAEVTARTGDTPSPPQAASTRGAIPCLQRSLSAGGLRKPAGRSRDARTWEFYCDSEARNALTEQAAREERGSATAAIGLIRSHSQSKVLTPNSQKRNAFVGAPDGVKRVKADGVGRPKFGRATSSLARLQMNAALEKSAKSDLNIFEDPNGESDKENWTPGTQYRPVSRPRSSQVRKGILRDPSAGPEIGPIVRQPELTKSLGEVVSRREEDLDCVQNLLRLSQATWR